MVAFKEFKVKMEHKKDKKLKAVRSDIGGELYGIYDETRRNLRPFSIYLLECGIDEQYIMLSTPQQNGITEKRNHTLLDMVRSI